MSDGQTASEVKSLREMNRELDAALRNLLDCLGALKEPYRLFRWMEEDEARDILAVLAKNSESAHESIQTCQHVDNDNDVCIKCGRVTGC